ncbi:putative regulatory protein [Actinacidiphila reveromycinica]|uniref:Putative regulatory protein n=1 Tax=Actinacidiphila reveromycinica TaxID=659352 RepID=A0A7U3UZY3_9ACTN|nr:ATP-binding protein [Streptomyces sp. SN-593]BBB01958.1 putative regulatory protein [Streptomyces sp. SN-593]
MTDHPFARVPLPERPDLVLHRRAAYGDVPDSIGAARDLTRAFLADIPEEAAALSDQTAGDVMLVVSELVTNAARHDSGARLLDLACTAREVEVTVWDTSSQLPQRFPRDPDRIGGHGIEIVARLCSAFEAEAVPGGKRVHARIALKGARHPTG